MTGPATVLLAAGLAGALFVLVHRRACAWADWTLITARDRRRVALVQRRLPVLTAGSMTLTGLGLLLGLVDLVGVAV